MNFWLAAFALSTLLTGLCFFVAAALWLKKLRAALAAALTETSHKQNRNLRDTLEALSELQKRQQLYEQRLQTLTHANIQMRRDMNEMVRKLSAREEQKKPARTPDRVLH